MEIKYLVYDFMLLEKDFKLLYKLFLLSSILDFTSMFVLVLGLGPKCTVDICRL